MAVGVGLGAIGGDEEVVEARHVVPGDRPRADGEVPPAVGDAELAEIDEADCSTTIEEDVGRAAVAVADRRLIPNADHPDRWAVTEALLPIVQRSHRIRVHTERSVKVTECATFVRERNGE